MNSTRLSRVILLTTVFLLLPLGGSVHGEGVLFEIGRADNNTAEFALGPDQSGQYSTAFPRDAVFVAGQSDPKKDWPYIQPGPADVWAGSKSHTFTILFGVESPVSEGTCELQFDFVDTHSARPPRLEIGVNGTLFEIALPRGAGDSSAFGEVEKGREHKATVEFAAKLLEAGTNTITITNSGTGSWFLYDYVALTVPDSVKSGKLTQMSKLLEVGSQPFLVERDGKLYQQVQASVLHVGEPIEARVVVGDGAAEVHRLESGYKVIEGLAPAVEKTTEVEVRVEIGGKVVGTRSVELSPVRKWEIYILHHSHVDIGYTHVQTDVLKKHYEYFDQVIELARESANYPEGSQFKWNAEVLWAVEGYMREAPAEKREAFVDAVKKGWIGLDALYGNELTALCRPEELLRLVDYAEQLRELCSVKIDSAMITDVPGYTWGIVPVFAQTGVKYFCVGPNRGHRIGYTLSAWGDKPFYWTSPCGQHKVLTWVAGEGYSLFHSGKLSAGRLFEYLKRLERDEYPYDMLQVRYSIGGDNGPPDPGLADYARDWNEKYAYPKLVVATTSDMFREFEGRYGDKLPVVAGDFTPYWEDGAGSSSRETAVNRASAERLVQAETLFGMLRPGEYPADEFHEAWRNVVLYDEHTWGAHNSISQPEADFVKSQWKIKQAFAIDGNRQSRELLDKALSVDSSGVKRLGTIDVYNTCSWPRTGLVTTQGWPVEGSGIKDIQDRDVPCQRLSSGELAFLASDVPALGARRFKVASMRARFRSTPAMVSGNSLSNGMLKVAVDEKTGAISSLKFEGADVDFADGGSGSGLNDYLYVQGRDPKEPQRSGPVKISVGERGPLVASLVIESEAPGAHGLRRELRVVAGLKRLDIIDCIDKKKIYAQEGVHIGFGFNVPDGVVRMDTPWAVVRPEADQLAGACKNYFTVQRWVDVSNDRFGVTLATPDAPLIEIGRITNDPRSSVGWIEKLEPSTTIYSYVMNNYWETNYKAAQEGRTAFRYSIEPHEEFDAARAAKFGAEASQPLICVPARQGTTCPGSLLSVEGGDVVATVVKPCRDGEGLIVRLYNPTTEKHSVRVKWGGRSPERVYMSNPAEDRTSRLRGPVAMVPYAIVTLRAEFAEAVK